MGSEFLRMLLSVLAAGGAGSAITVLVQGMLRRDREQALVQKLTAAANDQIYESYSGLLVQMRSELAATKEEVRSARTEAQSATIRATDAEARAAGAEARAAVAQTTLREICGLMRERVPEMEGLLVGLERLVDQS